jgi:hypothetical protein
VCDGCGSTPYSQVGAYLTARFFAAETVRLIQQTEHHFEKCWSEAAIGHISKQVFNSLDALISKLSSSTYASREWQAQVEEFLLCTVTMVVVGPKETCIMNLGDGFAAINDDIPCKQHYPNNAPPYFGYGIMKGEVTPLHLTAHVETSKVNRIVIGTDGAFDCFDPIGIDVFGDKDDNLFTNPDKLRRNLIKAQNWSKDQTPGSPSHGLYKDDTTLIIIER